MVKPRPQQARRNRGKRMRGKSNRSVARKLEHIASDVVVPCRVPNDPPPVKSGLEYSRIIEFRLFSGGTSTPVITPGSLAATGTIVFTGGTSGWKITLTDTQIAAAAIAQTLGTSTSTPVFALAKAQLWGPLSNENALAELAVSNNAVVVQRVYDHGTRTTRPKVGMTIPRLRWFSQASPDVAINLQIGSDATLETSSSTALGVMHLTVHVRIQPALNITDAAGIHTAEAHGGLKRRK